jgi:hypothetical protein
MAGVHHETSDANIRGILGFGLGLLIVGIVIHSAVWLLFQYFSVREARRVPAEYPLAASQSQRLPPEPRLQSNPREDLRAFRAREDAILTTYGWIDKTTGTVRIPIDQAMKMTLEQGLPVRQEVRK